MPSVTVRYIVDDVDAAIAFYADRLGFEEVMHPAPTFAMLVRGELRLVLSRPSSAPGGGQVVGDRVPRPGGWNRFALEVDDVDAAFTELRRHDVAFRGPIVDGVGGRQVIAEDPSGNPVELFQPTIPEARLDAHAPPSFRSAAVELLQVSPAQAQAARHRRRDAQADDTPVLGSRARRIVTEMAGFQLLPTTLIAVIVSFVLTSEVALINTQREPTGHGTRPPAATAPGSPASRTSCCSSEELGVPQCWFKIAASTAWFCSRLRVAR